MKAVKEYFFCSSRLLSNVKEIDEIEQCIKTIEWRPEFAIEVNGIQYFHQHAYNKAFEIEFKQFHWLNQPLLYDNPRLIGDFGKNDIFIEIQFGNSSTLFRDYYKFHFGLTHNLLSLAVLIVPTRPKDFFPTRPKSVNNMAEFELAVRYFRLLPIPVPIIVFGLLPEN